jgi:hypothetical protein
MLRVPIGMLQHLLFGLIHQVHVFVRHHRGGEYEHIASKLIIRYRISTIIIAL